MTWVYQEKYKLWELREGNKSVTILPRPHYCDRGRYYAQCFGFEDVDWQDSFPRYYMDLERAKLEMRDWFVMRYNRSAVVPIE